jgi:hypothetical protein
VRSGERAALPVRGRGPDERVGEKAVRRRRRDEVRIGVVKPEKRFERVGVSELARPMNVDILGGCSKSTEASSQVVSRVGRLLLVRGRRSEVIEDAAW